MIGCFFYITFASLFEGKVALWCVRHIAQRKADNVVVMYQSRIFRSGTVEEIFKDPESLCEVLLNVPQISRIMQALKQKGFSLDGKLYTVGGALDSIIRFLSEVVK